MFFFETIVSMLFPDRCVGCSRLGSLACPECMRAFSPAPSTGEPTVLSLYAYHDPRVRRLIKLLKYKNTRHGAAVFGPALASLCMEYLGEEIHFISGTVLVVPVPLARKRLRMRGYNQSELLAKALLSNLPRGASLAVLDTELLEKYVETKAQADITHRDARLKNLGACFRVREGRVACGETIVLVDDVTTTGATFAACRRALEDAGFRRVFAIAVAH